MQRHGVPSATLGLQRKSKKDDTKEIIMVVLHLRRVDLSLYVNPKWSSRELEGLQRLVPRFNLEWEHTSWHLSSPRSSHEVCTWLVEKIWLNRIPPLLILNRPLSRRSLTTTYHLFSDGCGELKTMESCTDLHSSDLIRVWMPLSLYRFDVCWST